MFFTLQSTAEESEIKDVEKIVKTSFYVDNYFEPFETEQHAIQTFETEQHAIQTVN